MKFKLLLVCLALSPLSGWTQGCKGIQYECDAAARDKSKSKEKSAYAWQYNNQSRYGNFAYGDTTEINIIVYKGVNYRISFCSLDEQIKDKIAFKVTEKEISGETKVEYVTKTREKTDANGNVIMTWNGTDSVPATETYSEKVQKRVYNKKPLLLYDNSTDQLKQYVEFATDRTRKLTIQVFVPTVGEKSKNSLAPTGFTCVGMLIEHQKGPGTTGWK